MTRPKVFAYYFPSWHRDPRNEQWFGPDWNEWKLLAEARPRFEGHRQPRTPMLGAFDEADPAVFEKQVELAARHAVDGFFFDFYWYDDGPYLNRALDEGLAGSANRNDIEFALMWANHNLVDIFPSESPSGPETLIKSGGLDRASFERMAIHIVESYFSQPNYLRIDNKPWFSIYEIGAFIEGLGGVDEAREALEWFDEYAAGHGFDGVHFDAVVWGFDVLPGAVHAGDSGALVTALGFASATSYVWIHHADTEKLEFPTSDWKQVEDEAFEAYEEYVETLSVPFYPNVTVGWDASPRTRQDAPFHRGNYPWIPVWDPSPGEFERGLLRAREFLARHRPPHPIVTINAWNEWTEGSALLPDTVNGLGYLEAVANVFGSPAVTDVPA